MKNRYDENLVKINKKILEIHPGVFLRNILAFIIKREYGNKEEARGIDIACGEGNSALKIIEKCPNIHLDLIDISKFMINYSKTILKDKPHIKFICDDILNYFKANKIEYDFITFSWFVHNLDWKEKKIFFKEMFSHLKKGGKLVILEKIYPSDKKLRKELQNFHLKRSKYLEENVKQEVIKHEGEDFSDKNRMDEDQTFAELKEIGFKNMKIIDRIERDVILIAEK